MKLAIYDFDGTYVNIQTLPFLYKLWKKEHMNDIARRRIWTNIMAHYVLNKLHIISKPKFRAYAMQITAKLFSSVKRDKLGEFLDLFYESLKPHFNKKVKEQLLKDKDDGFYTILLSGNFDIILKPFLNEGFDRVIGSDLENEEGLKDWKDVKIIIGEGKSDVIKKLFPDAEYESSKAYADSYYDMPIFELVGIPIPINPDKKLVRKIK